jgi:hypothetical protein
MAWSATMSKTSSFRQRGGQAASVPRYVGEWLVVDVMLHEGLRVPTTGSNVYRLRSGRQKTSEARARIWL